MSRSRSRVARELHGFLTHEVSGGRAPAPDPGIAVAVLRDLHEVAMCDCLMFMTPDTTTPRMTTLANDLYPDAVRRLFESDTFVDRHRHRVAMGDRVPTRRRENPSQQSSSEDMMRSWGFQDGFSLPLWSRGGRWVGTVIGSTLRSAGVDDEAIDLLALLAPSLVPLLDPQPRLQPLGGALLRGDADGFVVGPTGRTTALTVGADVDLARRGGPLWPMVHSVLEGPERRRSATLLLGSRVLSVSAEADRHGALVLHRVIAAPYGLSVRELEILDALSYGATNTALAARFAITRRTVATYVERLLLKTGCPNRTAAARLAARLDLVVGSGHQDSR